MEVVHVFLVLPTMNQNASMIATQSIVWVVTRLSGLAPAPLVVNGLRVKELIADGTLS